MASYNIKQESIDELSGNKENKGKRTFKKSRKSGKNKKNTKTSHNPDITILFPIALSVSNTLMWYN